MSSSFYEFQSLWCCAICRHISLNNAFCGEWKNDTVLYSESFFYLDFSNALSNYLANCLKQYYLIMYSI